MIKMNGVTEIKIADLDINNTKIRENILARDAKDSMKYTRDYSLATISSAELIITIDEDSAITALPYDDETSTVNAEDAYIRASGNAADGRAISKNIEISLDVFLNII